MLTTLASKISRTALCLAAAPAVGLVLAGCPAPGGPDDGGADARAMDDADAVSEAGPRDGSPSDSSPTDGAPPACHLALCADGMAFTCDRATVLACGSFGASCGTFTAMDGASFGWCNCGSVAEGAGRCFDSASGVMCTSGVGLPVACPSGTRCTADPALPDGISCACDNVRDGVCPDAACTMDPDCTACTPNCGTRRCGDNGCMGSCGSCPVGQACSAAGSCVPSCVPDCAGRECGADGCGGTCGSGCAAGTTCNTATGRCTAVCMPIDCAGRPCGSNGCGGTCGAGCPSDRECSTDGTRCTCPFFSVNTYTFDGSAIDWSATRFVHVYVTQVGADNPPSTPRDFLLSRDAPRVTQRFNGCVLDVQVARHYYQDATVGSAECMIAAQEVTGRATITIPAPVYSASSCTAPAL